MSDQVPGRFDVRGVRWPVGRGAAVGFPGLVGVLVSLAAVRRGRRASVVSKRAGVVMDCAEGLLVGLLNAETGQRGFLLTGRPEYLGPYHVGSRAAERDLAALAAASGSDARLAAEFSVVGPLVAEKLAELARTVALEQSGARSSAMAVVNTNAGKRAMDAIRERIAVIDRRAGQLERSAREAADRAQDLALVIDALLIALALTFTARARAARDRAFEELEGEARLERALGEVAAGAAGEPDEGELAGLIAARLFDLFDARSAAVVRAEQECLRIIGYHGPTPYPEQMGWEEASSSAQAIRSGALARVEDYGTDQGAVARFVVAQGVNCGMSVPVRMAGRVWGCLTVTTTREGGFMTGQERWLERFASLTSAALASARARTQLRAEARLEGALRDVALASTSGRLDERALGQVVADRVADLLHAPNTAVARFDEGWMTMLGYHGEAEVPGKVPFGEPSVVDEVRLTGATVRVRDFDALDGRLAQRVALESGVSCAVGVPVFVEGAVWGAVIAGSAEATLSPDMEGALERFAELVSVALANSQAQARLREEAQLEGALREVAAATAGGELDAHELFTLIATRAGEVMNASAAAILSVEGTRVTPVGAYGLDRLPAALPFTKGAATSVAWATGRSARVEDFDALGGGDAASDAVADGHRSALATPVSLRGRQWGLIAVANTDPYSFPPGAETVLERFAGIIAVALAQASAQAELQRQASTDGLTGLLNHRSFQEHLQHEFARARRHDRPLSLVVFDLDAFKLVNDLHGHSAGDRALEAVGRALAREQRAGDIPARVGGDEFAVIAPETTAEEALVLAERMRAAVTEALDQLALPVTLSAGVTDLTHAQTMRDLFHLADSALYHAKHHGRDRVELYTPGVENDFAARDSHRRLVAHNGIAALLRASDAKDAHTSRHSERVAHIAAQLAARLGWPAERCDRLHEAARLHDVGKIAVPDGILRKPGELTAEEYEHVKTHARLGAQIAAGVLDAEQVSWIHSHHERPDGQGYPDALTTPDIPDGALIIAAADAYDAITTGRPYKAAISPTDAIAEMRLHTGTQFDATLINELEDWARYHENGAGRDAASVQPIAPAPATADPVQDATSPSERQQRSA